MTQTMLNTNAALTLLSCRTSFMFVSEKSICFCRIVSLTFCSAICDDAPLNRFERAHCRGALQHAHLPLSPQFAVPCGAPDVACRIIRTHTLMKVSIWPHMHILSPQTQICMGKQKRKQTKQNKKPTTRYCCGIPTAV